MKKRGLCLILASLMLLISVACSETKENSDNKTDETTGAVSADTTTESTETEEQLSDYDKRQLIPDNLPDVKSVS